MLNCRSTGSWSLKLANFLVIFSMASAVPVQGQVTSDRTLGTRVNGSTSLPCHDGTCTITGGITDGTGKNLFHSFQDFSVLNSSGTAFFNNATSIQNIISRVTGVSVSTINGRIRANSSANVFLFNPNGVIFGPNARLNIGGSFMATTADAIAFGTTSSFGVATGSSVALLTVNPSAILFNQIAKPITSQARLQVPDSQSLLLVGGDITLDSGRILAPGGRVELGGLAEPGTVQLRVDSNNLRLGFPQGVQRADVSLLQGAVVDVSGDRGGNIQIQGRHITLTDESRISAKTGSQNGGRISIEGSRLFVQGGSQISASTTGAGQAGNLDVDVSDLVQLSGTSADGQKPSKLADDSDEAAGNGGNLTINTRTLIIDNGSRVSASSSGTGQAGNIDVNADLVELIGTSPGGRRPSGLSVQNRGTGEGGSLTINTRQLMVKDGAEVSAATFGAGVGGTVKVNASELVELSGVATSADGQLLPSTLIAQSGGREVLQGGVSPPATGNGGSLMINTGQLIVRDGAEVTVSSEDLGNAGELQLNADSVQLSNQGKILAETVSGDGGSINLQVQNLLQLNHDSAISAQSQGTGKAGTITIQAGQIFSTNNSQITTQALQAGGGDLNVTASDIRLRHSSPITSSVLNSDSNGNGGNITIHSKVFIALEDSDILANAVQGNGGNITINSSAFLADFFSSGKATSVGRNPGDFDQFRSNNRVDISASSQVGIAGNVTIPDFTFLQSSLSQLAGDFVSPDQVVAGSCLARRHAEQGRFTVTGTGGLAPTPYESVSNHYQLMDVQPLNSGAEEDQSSQNLLAPSEVPNWQLGDPVHEAQGMTVSAEGRIIVGTTPQLMAIADLQKLICHPTEVEVSATESSS